MFHMCIVSFLQISVPEDGSTFMNQIYNFVGIFFCLILLYCIKKFGQKTSVDRHSSCCVFPLVHFYIKIVQWNYKVTRITVEAKKKKKKGSDSSPHALSLLFQ